MSIVDFQFSESFTTAIEAKVTAEQRALESLNKLEQIKYDAQQRIIEADATKNATITLAEAEALKKTIEANATAQALLVVKTAEAESIRLLLDQLRMQNQTEYLQYLAILQWNGILPYIYAGDQLPFLFTLPTNATAP